MPHHDVNGVRLYYEFHGPEDGELVILNNGIFMSTTTWAWQLRALTARYRVLAYDMRGQGQSEHPTGEYSLELHADDLVALMDALGLRRAHLVGTSYGGELNLVMGVRYPERCHSLTVITSLAYSDRLTAAMVERWRLAAQLNDGPRFFHLIYADVYSAEFLSNQPELLPMAEQRYAALDLAAAVRLIESFQRFDIRADLAQITVPTCIVSAERDLLKPPHYGESMHRSIAGSEFHVIPNAGHVAVIERPAEVNTIILGFLAKHPLRKRSTRATAEG